MTHEFREDGFHYNGGKEFFGYGYRAVGEPRLKMIRRWYRRGERRGKTEDRFFVDGEHVPDYAAALVALKTPPVLTESERRDLALFTDQPVKMPEEVDIHISYSLREKGFISASQGRWTITESGRAVLAEKDVS